MNEKLLLEAEERVMDLLRETSAILPKLPLDRPAPSDADEAFAEWWAIQQRVGEKVSDEISYWARTDATRAPLSRDETLLLLLRASSAVYLLRQLRSGKAHAGGALPQQCRSATAVIEFVMGTLWEGEQFARDELRGHAERQYN